MLNNQTMTALSELGLRGMATAFPEQLESVQYLELSFEERLSILVERVFEYWRNEKYQNEKLWRHLAKALPLSG